MHTSPHRPSLPASTRSSYNSEQVLLSIVLLAPEQFDRVREQIPPDAFEEELHAAMFRALGVIREAGNSAFTFASILREVGDGYESEFPGGVEGLLRRLVDMGAMPSQLDYDLGVVREAFERRACVLAMQQTIDDLQKDRVSPRQALDAPRQHFARLGAKEIRSATGSARGLEFVRLDELDPASEPDWVWPGYAAAGCITILSAAPKAGKSTLLRSLLRDLYRGGPLAGTDRPMTAPTLIVSEETAGHWARQAEALDLPRDLLHLCAQPFFAKPSLAQWEQAVAKVAASVERLKPRLVIFDTLSNLWPVRDENSAAEVNAALMPIRSISELGPAVILVHHDRKGGGHHGEGARGSSAIGGFADALVQLKRYRDDPADTRRRLAYVGRFDCAEPQTVIDLEEGGYRPIGPQAQVHAQSVMEHIAEALPEDGTMLTVAEIRERVEGIGINKLRDLLHSGASKGLWREVGSGGRTDPYKYGLARTEAHTLADDVSHGLLIPPVCETNRSTTPTGSGFFFTHDANP